MTESAAARRAFPNGFVWGAATAGHQIEGNNVNSDFWFLENLEPTMFVERSADACDSYHRYEEDISFLAGLGLTVTGSPSSGLASSPAVATSPSRSWTTTSG